MINIYDSVVACTSAGTPHSQKQGTTSYTATKRNWLSFVTVFVTLFCFTIVQGQTTLISPTTDGGFENGSTFTANGWTAVNAATDGWAIGATPVASEGLNCGYVSTNGGTAWAYSQLSTFTHIYKDFTIPAGENILTLKFKWKAKGEGTTSTDWDNMRVFIAPTTVTPISTAAVSGATNLVGPGAISGMYKLNDAAWNSETIVLSGTPGTTYRLIFSWKSDGADIVNPPAALDEISLISRGAGAFISVASGNWNTPATWDANAVPTALDNATVSATHTVTADIATTSITNLTVNGNLAYATACTNIAVGGNLTVATGGLVNVFFTTTGKTLTVTGNITNNGRIDVSVGTTTAGTLTLNGTTVQTVSGIGTFGGTVTSTTTTNTADVIRNLIINNTNTAIPNIIWSFNNIKIANNLTFTNAKVNLGTNKLTFGNFAAGGTLIASAPNGILPGAKFSRWWISSVTGTAFTAGTDPSNGTSRYPFINATGLNRAMYITRTSSTGAVAGELAVVYTDATTNTLGLSIADGAYTITDRYDGNWMVSKEGTAVSATSYSVALIAPITLYPLNGNARVMGAAAAISGTHQNGSATPGAQRTLVTQTDLLAGPLYIGIAAADIPFVSIANGDWNATTTWNKGTLPTCTDLVTIAAGTNVTVNSNANVSKGISIASGGTLTVSSGDVTVGCTLNNNTLTNNGTLTVSGGTLNINGNLINNLGSTFNQSGGDINIDGNAAGNATNSVASGTAILQFNQLNSGINLTGGTLTIVDPHANTTSSNSVGFSNSTPGTQTSTASHTLRFGDGISTDAGGNVNGFRVDPWTSSAFLSFGSIIVNGSTGTNRSVTCAYQLAATGNVTVTTGSTLNLTSSLVAAGNVSVNSGGTFINSGGISAALIASNSGSALTFGPSTLAQTIGGSGTYQNLATTPTANLTNLNVNNTNATGVTLSAPLSVSGTLTMSSGIINTTNTNLLTLGTATAAGTLAGTPSATNMVKGPFARTIASGNTNSTYVLFPVGTTAYAPVSIAPATTAVTVIKAEVFDSNTGTQNAAITNLTTSRRWEAPIVSGTVTDVNVRLADAGILATSIPVQAPTATGEYTNSFGSVATAVVGATTQSNTAVTSANYTGFLSYANSNACSGTPAPGNTIASTNAICLGTSVTLSLQNATSGTGVTYEWKSSIDGITYTAISGATNPTLTVTPSASLYYLCDVTCATGPATGTSTAVQITFTNSVTSSTPGTRCGTGTVDLSATPSAGGSIKWYAAETGGTALATGTTFTTPSISSNTTYYVAAETTGGDLYGGKLTPEASWTGSTISNWGIVFTALQTTTLNSVDVYSTVVGTLDVKVTNAAGVELYSTGNINVAAGGTTTPTVIPLNFSIVQGTTYKILVKASSGVSLVRGSTNLAFPYNNGAVNVTSSEWGGTTTGTYYYFYNFKTPSTCSSTRVPVVALVTTPPALTLSVPSATICESNSTAVTLTSIAGDYNTYTWSPSTGVIGDENTGWTFNPSVSTNYTLTASQTGGSLCTTTATFAITVNPRPSVMTITPSPAPVCVDAIQALVVNGGTLNNVSILNENFNASTNSWTLLNASTGGTLADAQWTLRNSGYVYSTYGTFSSNDASQFYLSNSDDQGSGGTTNTALISPSFATTNFTAATVSFWHYYRSSGTAKVQYSTDGGTIWTDIQSYTATTGAIAGFVQANLVLPAGALNQANVKIRFKYDASWGYFWAIDNVSVTGTLPTQITWLPIDYLFTDASATIPYVANATASTVYFKSSTTAAAVTYTATSTTSFGCFRTATTDVTVNSNNTVTAASSSPTVCINTAITAITHTTTGATGIATTTTNYGLPAGVLAVLASNTITISGTPTASGTFNYDIPLTGGCGTVSATGTITVTANNTASAASTTPTVCINTAITDITHTTTGATGIATTTTNYGLPAGVLAVLASNTITISGTPTASGTFNYDIPLTGGCGTVSATGTITVTANNTASAASTTPTVCINTAITAITHTTTGATGIATTTTNYGLPAGVLAVLASNTITISGTPTASGTFNYDIPLTGGCGTASATGTITVTANNTASAASSSPTVCINTAITDITHTTTGATGIATTTTNYGLPAGVLAVLASNTITISGTPTASGTFNYDIPLTGGCGTVSATGTITVTPLPGWFNTQFPSSASICEGGSAVIYGQVYLAGITDPAGQASGMTAQLGYSSSNTDPNTWSNWINASFNVQTGNNDEFLANIGSSLGVGTYFYAFRYSYNGCTYVYGGLNGPWNGTTNNSGTLTITANNTASAASSSPTVCINTAITAITHTTTGATGIATTTTNYGLPAGVLAVLASNTITISGTPTASGTFNYDIPLTGGCGTVSATGTITVTAASTNSTTTSACGSYTWLVNGTTYTTNGTYTSVVGCLTETLNLTINALPITTITRTDDVLTVTETGAIYQWYTCTSSSVGTIISGATSQSYTATAAGSYAVQVTKNGCSEMSACFDVATLSSNSFDLAKLSYYPNPVVDILTISYSSEITSVQVYDISGRQIRNIKPNSNLVTVDLSDLATSVYVVRVFANDTSSEFKVVKK